MPKYLYNKQTGCLHIEGYCTHASPDMEKFSSENEAIAHGGRKIHMCLSCMRKNERRIAEEKK